MEVFESVVLQFKGLIEELGLSRAHIHITGGEPLSHPFFYDFLEILKSHSSWLTFAVLTNGTLMTKEAAEKIAVFGPLFTQVSLDGGEEIHDRVRGDGSFNRAVKGIRNLKKAGIPVQISFTASKINFREFSRVAATARKLKGIKVWSDRFLPMGNGLNLTNEVLGQNDLREFFELMAKERQKRFLNYLTRTKISANRALQFIVNKTFPYSCSAGKKLLALMPDGTVYPCRRLPLAAGNLKDQGLKKIYFESPVLLQMREKIRNKPEGCKKCSYFIFCKGGARCMSFSVSGDWRKKDPFCLY